MKNFIKKISTLNNYYHNYFGLALLLAVTFATFLPQLGLSVEKNTLGTIIFPDESKLNITWNIVIIQIILFNVSMCINRKDLLKAKSYIPVIIGFIIIDILLGCFLAGITRVTLPFFLDIYIVQQIIIGIAIIAVCPSAATSAAWSQVSGGNISLSLGMILISTLLTPFISPLLFKNFMLFTDGEFQQKLFAIAEKGASFFMTFVVAVPCLLGLIGHFLFEKKIENYVEIIKFINFTGLTILMYTLNSSVLPSILLGNTKILMIVFLVICSCTFNISWFLGGKTVAYVFKAEKREKISLIIGMGVKNITAGMVLAHYGFAEYKITFFIITVYGLIESFLASRIKWYICKHNINDEICK